MTHILDDRVAIAVDADHLQGWGGGLAKLRDVRADDAVISVAFFDPHLTVRPNDPKGRTAGDGIVTKQTLDEWTGYGRISGLRFDPSWYGWPEPGVAAKRISDEIARFDEPNIRRVQVCEYDVETHDITYQLRLLLGYVAADGTRVKGLRGRGGSLPIATNPDTLGWRWNRPFVWTCEGRQVPDTAIGSMVSLAGGKFAPQLYNGAMDEVWDAQREYATWVRSRLVDPSLYTVYTDARREHRPKGLRDQILFATTRLTELYE